MNHWTTQDGSKLRIIDMTDEHILNVLKYLSRRYWTREESTSIFDSFPDYKYILDNAKHRKILTDEHISDIVIPS